MQQSMMVPAKQQQIIHAGLTPVAPVLYMVCIDKARLTATWKTAAPVTQAQCPANSRRDGTGLAPDIEHITRPILHDTDQTGITGEAPLSGRAASETDHFRSDRQPCCGLWRDWHRDAPRPGIYRLP